MLSGKKSSPGRDQLIVIGLLSFAVVADLVSGLVMQKELGGIVSWFAVLGGIFILQESFRPIRIFFICILILIAISFLIGIFANLDLETLTRFFRDRIIIASVMPLYVFVTFISALVFLFVKKYK